MQALRKCPESVFRNGQSSPPLWSAITGLGVRVGSTPASTAGSASLLRALQSGQAAAGHKYPFRFAPIAVI